MDKIYTQEDMNEAIDDAVGMLYDVFDLDTAFEDGYNRGYADGVSQC